MLRSLLDRLVIRIHLMRCSMYVGDCSYCREWKRAKAAKSQ